MNPMMITKKLLLVPFFTLLILGNKCNQTAGEYFKRPKYTECIVLADKGKMACNGKVFDIPQGMTIPKSQEEFEDIRVYYMKHEQFSFECQKYNRCN